jgi:hypothetical protein
MPVLEVKPRDTARAVWHRREAGSFTAQVTETHLPNRFPIKESRKHVEMLDLECNPFDETVDESESCAGYRWLKERGPLPAVLLQEPLGLVPPSDVVYDEFPSRIASVLQSVSINESAILIIRIVQDRS